MSNAVCRLADMPLLSLQQCASLCLQWWQRGGGACFLHSLVVTAPPRSFIAAGQPCGAALWLHARPRLWRRCWLDKSPLAAGWRLLLLSSSPSPSHSVARAVG